MRSVVDALRRDAQAADKAGDWPRSAELHVALAAAEGASLPFWDRHNLIRALMFAGRLDAAQAELTRLPEDAGNRGSVLFLHAMLAELRLEHARSATLWVEARAAGASAYWTLFGEARALSRLGRYRQAQKVMALALQYPEANSDLIRLALDVDLKLQDFAAAEGKFRALNADAAVRESAILAALPGMTRPQERDAVHRAAATMSGNGQIVDLGCFLGSLTAAMAAGLAKNERALSRGVRVHAFDLFEWYAPIMDQFWIENFPGPRLKDGERFTHLFQYLTRQWERYITLHEGDLTAERWIDPIEVLSVDAMKTRALSRHIVTEFMPRLIPGALVFHQDYCFRDCWWIPIFHYLLREHFEVADTVAGASGVLFRLTSPIAGELAQQAAAHDLHDTRVADEAFEFSMRLVAAEDRREVAAGHVTYYQTTQPEGYEARIRELREAYANL